MPVKDTIKAAARGNGKTVPDACLVYTTPDRSTLYAVQTPQCFDRAAYLAALDELDAEKARLADAIGWELAQAPMEIRKRQLDLFAKVSADLANRVSREIYLFETGRKG